MQKKSLTWEGGQVPLAGVAAVLCWVKSTLSCKKPHFDLPSAIASSTSLGKSSRTKLAYSDNSLSTPPLCCNAESSQVKVGIFVKDPEGLFPCKCGSKLLKQINKINKNLKNCCRCAPEWGAPHLNPQNGTEKLLGFVFCLFF